MSEENKKLESDKIAIVTGGSRGIGRNTVLSLAKRGVHAIFTYHNRSVDAEAVVSSRNDKMEDRRGRSQRRGRSNKGLKRKWITKVYISWS
jgi:NAD(P)-dependent dehydrogenase (short-subunit alcohol dehydrogenase family)